MKDTPLRLAKEAKPELYGYAGMAWLHDTEAAVARLGRDGQPPLELTVASWLIYRPDAHPMWSYYWLGCVSLRDVPNAPPPLILLEGATHEVMLYALNPGVDPALDQAPSFLMPGNFHGQFIESSDDAAALRIRATVQDLVEGRLNPDTDHVSSWKERFSDSNSRRPSGIDSIGGH